MGNNICSVCGAHLDPGERCDCETTNESKEEETYKMKVNPALQLVREVVETADIEKVAELLSKGDWIAIAATKRDNGFLFSVGRIEWQHINIATCRQESKA